MSRSRAHARVKLWLVSDRAFLPLAVVAGLAVTIAAIAWMVANPLPSYWDEAIYFVNATHDVQAIHAGGLRGFLITMSAEDRVRPPALRLFALPLTLAFGPHLLAMRLISFAGFLAAIGFIAAAVQRAAGARSAAFSALLALASPMLILSTKVFGTEYPLLVASAALLYFVTMRHHLRWIGIGLALGVGALAKASFALIGGPILVTAIVLPLMDRKNDSASSLPSFTEHAKAMALGATIALLWWGQNFDPALHYASSSRSALRHSLGPASLATLYRWAYEFFRCDVGWLSAMAIIIAGLFLHRWSRNPVVVLALAGAIPQLLASAIGPNHNPRYAAPAVLLLAAAVAVVAEPLLHKPLLLAACGGLVLIQIALVSLPLRTTPSFIWRSATEVNAPVEQWDFRVVKQLADRIGAPIHPRISVLGVGYAMNPPQVEAAWIRGNSDAPVRTLWGADRESFDMRRTLDRALSADIVITAPGFRGDRSDRQPRDNAFNVAFAQVLASTRLFAGPYTVEVGVNEPATVAVFVRRPHA